MNIRRTPQVSRFTNSRHQGKRKIRDTMRLLTSFVFTLVYLLDAGRAANFTNPLRARDGSDPFIVWDKGHYYLLATTWNDVRITRATTLEGLKRGEERVVWRDTNASRCCNVWAPELHQVDGTWYVYYSAGNRQNLDGQRSHVLRGKVLYLQYNFSTN